MKVLLPAAIPYSRDYMITDIKPSSTPQTIWKSLSLRLVQRCIPKLSLTALVTMTEPRSDAVMSEGKRRIPSKLRRKRPPILQPSRMVPVKDSLLRYPVQVVNEDASEDLTWDLEYPPQEDTSSHSQSSRNSGSTLCGSEFCVLQAENTLFNVDKSVLCRDNSAFHNMFYLNSSHSAHSSNSGRATPTTPITKKQRPIQLTDTVDQLKDLLRVLHALPVSLPVSEIDPSTSPSKLPRLLNVAELSLKYAFSSIELWAIEHIQLILQSPKFFLSVAQATNSASSSSSTTTLLSKAGWDPDETFSRIINISLEGHHDALLSDLVQKLVSRILWYHYSPGPRLLHAVDDALATPSHSSAVSTSEREALERLRGVIYYRRLIACGVQEEYEPATGLHSIRPTFPSALDLERRMRFLSAYQTLTSIWDRLCIHPPDLPEDDESDAATLADIPFPFQKLANRHSRCTETWNRQWMYAIQEISDQDRLLASSRCLNLNRCTCACYHPPSADTDEPVCFNPGDVLAHLKSLMLRLRKRLGDHPGICLECTLAGLEAIANIRDELVNSLPRMFEYIHDWT